MSTIITGVVTNGVVVPSTLLPEGAHVEIQLCESSLNAPLQRQSMVEFLGTLPPDPLLFKTPEDANRYLQEERDSWER